MFCSVPECDGSALNEIMDNAGCWLAALSPCLVWERSEQQPREGSRCLWERGDTGVDVQPGFGEEEKRPSELLQFPAERDAT